MTTRKPKTHKTTAKPVLAWGMVTERGRLRTIVWRFKDTAKECLCGGDDRVVRVEIREVTK